MLKPGKHCAKGTAIAWNQRGPRGLPGTARAFAYVHSDGTLDTSHSKNVLDVRPTCFAPCSPLPAHAASSLQCLKLTFTPANGVATTDVVTRGGTAAQMQIPAQSPGITQGCPPGYAVEVFTFETDTPSATPTGFYAMFN